MKTFHELRENLTNKDWSKDSKAVKNSKDPKFISAMINKWGERGGAWLGHPALKNEDYNQGLDELSIDTIKRYKDHAEKSKDHAKIGLSKQRKLTTQHRVFTSKHQAQMVGSTPRKLANASQRREKMWTNKIAKRDRGLGNANKRIERHNTIKNKFYQYRSSKPKFQE